MSALLSSLWKVSPSLFWRQQDVRFELDLDWLSVYWLEKKIINAKIKVEKNKSGKNWFFFLFLIMLRTAIEIFTIAMRDINAQLDLRKPQLCSFCVPIWFSFFRNSISVQTKQTSHRCYFVTSGDVLLSRETALRLCLSLFHQLIRLLVLSLIRKHRNHANVSVPTTRKITNLKKVIQHRA